MARHPVWSLITQQEAERLTVEDLYNRIERLVLESTVIRMVNKLEEKLGMATTAVQRLQDDIANQTQMLKDQQTAMAAMAQALLDANTRMENDIAALRNSAGSADPNALNAIADSMEQNNASIKAVSDQLTATATAEAGLDPAPAPVPMPPQTLAISPQTVSVARGTTQSFVSNLPGQWKATNGIVGVPVGGDGTSMSYIPPTDTTITSDTLTFTTTDGTQSATAVVTITS